MVARLVDGGLQGPRRVEGAVCSIGEAIARGIDVRQGDNTGDGVGVRDVARGQLVKGLIMVSPGKLRPSCKSSEYRRSHPASRADATMRAS